jgi:hypothetical protein
MRAQTGKSRVPISAARCRAEGSWAGSGEAVAEAQGGCDALFVVGAFRAILIFKTGIMHIARVWCTEEDRCRRVGVK